MKKKTVQLKNGSNEFLVKFSHHDVVWQRNIQLQYQFNTKIGCQCHMGSAQTYMLGQLQFTSRKEHRVWLQHRNCIISWQHCILAVQILIRYQEIINHI